MKVFVVLSALLAVASASTLYLAPAHPLAPAVSSQYHFQDGIGQYAYGYNDPLSTKQETKSLDGTTRGGYSYIDSNNVLQTVNYVSDAGGFRVSATNLPKPVEAPVVSAHDVPQQVPDSIEVAAAKSAHLAAVEEAKQRLSAQQIVTVAAGGLPQQVQDTPEVAKAKAEHFAAIAAAKNQVGYQALAIPTPIELPRPVQDTPEVVKAKADHLLAIEQAKQRNYFPYNAGGISLVQSAPIIAYSLPSHQGFSYSSSVVDSPISQYAYGAIADSAHFTGAKPQWGEHQIILVPAGGLPQQVLDTPEVSKAKVEHFAAKAAAKNQIGYQVLAVPAPIELPRPVQDTPEVAKAKAEHLLAIEQAKLRDV